MENWNPALRFMKPNKWSKQLTNLNWIELKWLYSITRLEFIFEKEESVLFFKRLKQLREWDIYWSAFGKGLWEIMLTLVNALSLLKTTFFMNQQKERAFNFENIYDIHELAKLQILIIAYTTKKQKSCFKI